MACLNPCSTSEPASMAFSSQHLFLPSIHIYDGTKCLHGWNYGLWPESAISHERRGMACKAWPESTISRECWGMAQLHRTGVEYKAPEWVVKSQGGR